MRQALRHQAHASHPAELTSPRHLKKYKHPESSGELAFTWWMWSRRLAAASGRWWSPRAVAVEECPCQSVAADLRPYRPDAPFGPGDCRGVVDDRVRVVVSLVGRDEPGGCEQ